MIDRSVNAINADRNKMLSAAGRAELNALALELEKLET